ncbi:DUF3300 domain-containing protein [Pseudomonadota bacterium]
MKATTLFRTALGLFVIPFLALCLVAQSRQVQAQDGDYLDPSGKYSRAELAQMLAPVALYPDALLAQILMASTYPIEVIEADRWVKRYPGLKDDTLDRALLDKDWDPSVKTICHFPSILSLLSERIAETTNLGNAFLAQEAEVMDVVQELRAKARAQGNLSTTAQQQVVVERETIIIQPADPRVIYVPYYDPLYVYGPWWYPGYPPHYWGPRGVRVGVGISYWPGFYFSFVFGTWSYFDWHHHHIYIDAHRRPRFVRERHWVAVPGRWKHSPRHRQGVAYRDKPTARRYGQTYSPPRDFGRNTRGYPEDREQDRDRRGAPQTWIGRVERKDDDRGRRQQTWTEPNRKPQVRVEAGRQEQKKSEPDKKPRVRVESQRQAQTRIEPGIKPREQAVVKRQVPARPQRQQALRAPRVKQPPDQQQRERAERTQQQRSRDNVFGRVDDGESARQSSQRGWNSRQGLGNNSRARERTGGDSDRGGRSRR